MKTLRRTIHPQIRVIDAKLGLVEYVASDESLDSYNEVVRANGARFNRFQKNAPFVDSHNYESIECCVGKVVDFAVRGREVIETCQWAIDVAANKLAQFGFTMTAAGYLKAVSIGFIPTAFVTRWDNDPTAWRDQLKELGLHEEDGVRCIYTEWEQMELSACILGANGNAVARAYKAGVIDDAALDLISNEFAKRETAWATDDPAVVAQARQRARMAFLLDLNRKIKSI